VEIRRNTTEETLGSDRALYEPATGVDVEVGYVQVEAVNTAVFFFFF